MPAEDFITVHFPMAGIDVGVAYSAQPPRDTGAAGYARSAAEAENVRGWEPSQDRCRGGSRSGLTKVGGGLVGSGAQIQALGVVIDPIADALSSSVQSYYPPGDYYIDGGSYPYPNPNDDSTGITDDDGVPDPSTNNVYEDNGWPVSPPPAPFPDPDLDPNIPDIRNPNRRLPHRGGLATHSRHRPRPLVGETYGWPCDQIIRYSGRYYAYGSRTVVVPNPLNPYFAVCGYNSGRTRGWRGPGGPAKFYTTPKGLIVSNSAIYQAYLATPYTSGAWLTDVYSAVTTAFNATLDSRGWYGAIPAFGTGINGDCVEGIPYSAVDGAGVPVIQGGGTYGRIALVYLAGLDCQLASPYFKLYRSFAYTGTPVPFDGYTVIGDYSEDVPDIGLVGAAVYRKDDFSDYAARWASVLTQYSRVDVLVAKITPGSPDHHNETDAAVQRCWLAADAAFDPIDMVKSFVGTGPAVTYTEVTLPSFLIAGESSFEENPAMSDGFLTSFRSWLTLLGIT